jgi:predicted 3-demethylubiquinone-9 3-methyltransferase (glyoxalase superfamily)
MTQRIIPNLWFDTEAEEAARFYTSIFDNSRIVNVSHYPEDGPRPAGMVMTVEFELDGERFIALNGGPEFTFDEAISPTPRLRERAIVRSCGASSLRSV